MKDRVVLIFGAGVIAGFVLANSKVTVGGRAAGVGCNACSQPKRTLGKMRRLNQHYAA